MSNTKERQSGDEPPSGSSIGTTAPDHRARPPVTWLGRMRAAIGLRRPATVRQNLADALATNDMAAGFSVEERALLANILRLREARVDDIMVPRADIEAVDIDTSLADIFAALRASGHSRLPVFRETLDDPVGLVHVKDLMGHLADAAGITRGDTAPAKEDAGDAAQGGTAAPQAGAGSVDLSQLLADTDVVRSILFVPPSMTVSVLLANMQASRMQMALVIDEYGGTDGLVSLEDAIETVVGDIEDEHDDEAGPMVVPDGNGGFFADARADLDEVSEAAGADLTNLAQGDDVDTVGGLIFSLAGRIPVRGELIEVPGGFEFEILDADPRRIKRLRISRRPPGRRAESRRHNRATG